MAKRKDPVGAFYCVAHDGFAWAGQSVCEVWEYLPDSQPDCDFRQCFIDRRPEARLRPT